MTLRCPKLIVAALVCAGLNAASALAADPVALKGYNAPIAESSISGISSGAFMAVQFGTAWSSVIKGVGVVAGGPYDCDEADLSDAMTGFTGPISRALGPCMKGPASDLDSGDFVKKADANAASGAIDALDNLKRQKIYLFHGTNDAVVAKPVTDATAAFYRHYLGDANRGNLFYQTSLGAGHSLVVQQDGQADLGSCNVNQSPYIDQCGYDQAGIILQHIYGRLTPPNRGQLAGTLQRFDQSAYTGDDIPDALSLGDSGYVFVPKDCADGAACRVHIALHGCAQDVGHIGQRYVDDTGYNAWADTNHLIVLYPQIKASSFAPANPQACWDWWSYINHSDDYVTKSGLQIKTIKAMLDALTSGVQAPATTSSVSPAAATPAKPGVSVIDISESGADLALDPPPTGASYRISRAGADGPFTVIAETTGPSYADMGLTPQTTYRWRIAIVTNGVEGPDTADVEATTRAVPPPCDTPGQCPLAAAK
jgi:poly(3-hydroxybutyrate) depolymerase